MSHVSFEPAHAPQLRPERPWQEHAPLYVDLFADPAVASALWPGALGGPRSTEQALELLAADIAHWQRRPFGPWVFFEARTGVFVGRGGLQATVLAGQSCVELMYAVRPDAWGRGYASEMAAVALAHARRIGLVEVVGLTTTTNTASQRVLSRAGLRFESVLQYAGLPHRLARLSLRPTATARTPRAQAVGSSTSAPR